MRNRKRLLTSLFLLLSTPFNAQSQSAAPVSVASAQVQEVAETVQLTGTVTARRNAQLSVSIAGLVTGLKVDAGDHVTAGDVLLTLDGELAKHQYNAARAQVTQTSLALTDAERRLEEARRLAPKQSIAETVLKDIAAEVAQDEAAMQRARAEAGYRQGLLDRHFLKAPFTGVISGRSVELGEWVTPGQAVFTLVSTEQLRLDFQVPEDYLGRLTKDMIVEFSVGADKSQWHKGKVMTTVPVTDPTVRTFLARVESIATIPGMRPGMSARAALRIGSGEKGVTVPRDAVLRYADGRMIVWVIEEKDGVPTAAERRVQTGFTFDGHVEIRSGLDAGEQVVVKGNEALQNGQVVAVRSYPSE